VTAMRLARAYDDDTQAAFKRIGTAVAKYWLCKRAVPHTGEALECFGGNGFVEESGMPRLYREAPLNGIWEGSGNVISLDVLRALVKTPETFAAFFEEVEQAAGADARLDRHIAATKDAFAEPETLELRARRGGRVRGLTPGRRRRSRLRHPPRGHGLRGDHRPPRAGGLGHDPRGPR